jgi:carbon storage regulator
MLILDRKENKSIMIGEDIEITIVNIKGDHAKIGINAPSSIKVYRKEIFEEIQKANIEAAKVKVTDIKDINKYFDKKKNQ